MATTTEAPAPSGVLPLLTLLVHEGKLALTPGATVGKLAASLGGQTIDQPNELMELLLAHPGVDELFLTDAEFAQALFKTHPAAPRLAAGDRPALRGMVVRAYELLGWLISEAGQKRRFAVIELAPPLLFARTAPSREGLDDEDPIDTAQANLDPLELGEAGPAACDPSEYEMLCALAIALERPFGTTLLREALARAGGALWLAIGEVPVAVQLEAPLDTERLRRALGVTASRGR